MNDIPLKQIIDATLSQIGSVADVNTVIGEPIITENGITIIPFSKVSVGFASGGADFDGKGTSNVKPQHFAGGNGAGVSVTPLGFLIIDHGDVRLLDLKNPVASDSAGDPVTKVLNTVNAIVDRTPDIIEKIRDMLGKKKSVVDESKETAANKLDSDE
ncbi:MAG: spore germination protein GerW family protein [Clostridia bacterium]